MPTETAIKLADRPPVTATPPKLRPIGPGVYDSDDGRVTLYRIEGCRPTAWNVEWTTEYQNWLAANDPDYSYGSIALSLIVDGAATKRDALALYADAWATLFEKLYDIEAASR